MARILVIDDEAPIRTMLRHMLERSGHEVLDASDGRVGMEIHRRQRADLIITDIIMPDTEGMETIRELKQEFPETKIIAMSGGGYVGPDDYLSLAKKLGAAETLTKPIDFHELLETVEKVLG